MIKMYNAEVLSKFPVVQHFPFGSLFSWDTDPNAPPPPSSVHASSQPFSLNNGVKSSSTEKVAPFRPLPQDSSKAPRATATNPASNLHTPAIRTSRLSTPTAQGSLGRPAPQSNQGPAHHETLPLGSETPFPTKFTGSDGSSRQPDTSNATPSAVNAASIPPPTRAPWAKGP